MVLVKQHPYKIIELLREWTGNSIVASGTGHRPKYMSVNGKAPYPNNPEAYNRLVACANYVLSIVKPEKMITGGALGWDMALAEASFKLGVYHILAQPHEEHINSFQSSETKTYYQSIVDRSQEVVSVSSGGYSEDKLNIRNEWMVDNSLVVLGLWNGKNSGTGNCINYATNKGVYIINFWDVWEKHKER